MKRTKFLKNASDKREERGATLIEYALLVALIVLIAIGGITFLGRSISQTFSGIGSTLTGTGAN